MNTENRQESTGRKENHKQKSIIKLILYIIILILLIILVKIIFTGNHSLSDQIDENIIGEEGKVETISVASILEVLEISELSTAEYMYNSIAKVYEEDGTTIRYYVAYEGLIKAGIDFEKIEVKINDKIITVSLPDIAIQEVTVDPGSLEYIFVDKKSETENVHKEAFELCQKDLEEKASNEDDLLSLALTNAEAMVNALITPWLKQFDSNFSIKFE